MANETQPEEVVSDARNEINALTLPAIRTQTEADKALEEERLANRRKILGDEAFEAEQKAHAETQKTSAKDDKGESDPFVEDALSGARTDDLRAAFEEGQRQKNLVADRAEQIAAEASTQTPPNTANTGGTSGDQSQSDTQNASSESSQTNVMNPPPSTSATTDIAKASDATQKPTTTAKKPE